VCRIADEHAPIVGDGPFSLRHATGTMPEPTSAPRAQDGPISDAQIRERAYDIWERHHRPEGLEMQFWVMARRELTAEREAKVASDAPAAAGAGDAASL
jgi:hypothetical protein